LTGTSKNKQNAKYNRTAIQETKTSQEATDYRHKLNIMKLRHGLWAPCTIDPGN